MVMTKPTKEDVRALKERHGLTAEQMTSALYGVAVGTVRNWLGGQRQCPALAWWALVLHFDRIDLRVPRCPACQAIIGELGL